MFRIGPLKLPTFVSRMTYRSVLKKGKQRRARSKSDVEMQRSAASGEPNVVTSSRCPNKTGRANGSPENWTIFMETRAEPADVRTQRGRSKI